MSTHRKTRADSVLGTLPEERQSQIAEYARAHTLDETCAWLKEDGVKLGRTALSLWLSSYSLRAQFKLADHDTLQFIHLLRQRRPDLPESELQQWGAEFFQMQALKAGDSETFLAYATARHKAKKDEADLRLKEAAGQRDDRRIKLLEQKAAQADEAKKTIGDGRLSAAEKHQRLRQIFGMT